jgi:glycosyltransferase involved in cell wall biosynthesis
MNRLPISAFIIARDEADRIPLAILSLRDWVDEVHVIDCGSHDDTVAVSAALGARTHYHAWEGYGPQKVHGESFCRNDWLLNIDADEEISPRLRDEIIALFATPPGHAAYAVPVLPLYYGAEHALPLGSYQQVVRLYRKTLAGYRDSAVHDAVVVRDGTVGHLRGMLRHRTFRSLTHHVDKVNAYSSAQAEQRYAQGRSPSLLALLATPPLAFIKSYVFRRGFLYRSDGLIVSLMYAFQRFLRLAKTRELLQQERRKRSSGSEPHAKN